jgi:nitric oxide reductase NorQ protein
MTSLTPAQITAIRARIANAKKAALPHSVRLSTPDPEPMLTNAPKPAFDDGLFAPHSKGIPVPGSTPATPPVERIDLELSPHLSSYLLRLAATPGTHNLRLIGPSGCGKTSIGQWLAQETNRPLLIMDCAVVREARDWFGFRTISNGSIIWQDTQFVRTVEAGNAVIVLDEMNRAPSSVLNGIFSLTDHRRRAWIEERQSHVTVGPNTIFISTTNVGSRFVGASPIDEALRNRFQRVIEVTYLPVAAETALLERRIPHLTTAQAAALSSIAAATRAPNSNMDPISTREIIAAASDLVLFGEQSLRYTMLSKVDDPARRAALATLLAGKFPSIVSDETNLTTTTQEPF